MGGGSRTYTPGAVTLLAAFVAGFLAGRLLWLLLRPTLATPAFLRENYRGHQVPVAGGLVVAGAALLVEAGRLAVRAAGWGEQAALDGARVAALAAVLGFALLGLLDDLAGTGDVRGFRGHVSSLARGRLTTGGLKLAGGGATAVVACAAVRPGAGLARLALDAALVALAANVANLFDRRPGRSVKVAGLCFVALAAATRADPVLAPVAVVAGAALALLVDDLQERVMLGDTGANPLGAVLGLGVVAVASPPARSVVLVILLVLNLVSEVVSFSRIIKAVPPLRALDRAGRSHQDAP